MSPRKLEFKNAPDGGGVAEIKTALAGITKTVDDGLKSLNGRMDEIERKANRARLMGTTTLPNGLEVDPEKAAAERKALGTFIRTGDMNELKAMSVGIDPDGGYLVAPVMSATMTKRLFDLSPMRRLARIETITSGDAFEEPIDTDEAGATWVGENESRPATTTPRVGMQSTPVDEIYSNQQVSQRMLDDSGFDIGGWVQGKISDKFGRSEATSFITGNGVKKPRGFLTLSTSTAVDTSRDWGTLQYVPTDSATDIDADDIRNLYWSLRAVHRSAAAWLMNSATANAIDKLKDDNGDYLWRSGMTAGAPPSLLGRPVEFAEDMPAIANGNFPIAFGDWKQGYLIVEKAGLKLLQDPYTNKPHVMFYAYRRVGGAVANSDAIKLLKVSSES